MFLTVLLDANKLLLLKKKKISFIPGFNCIMGFTKPLWVGQCGLCFIRHITKDATTILDIT